MQLVEKNRSAGGTKTDLINAELIVPDTVPLLYSVTTE